MSTVSLSSSPDKGEARRGSDFETSPRFFSVRRGEFDDDLKYWLPFSYFGKFGPVRFRKILQFFPSMEEAYRASGADLMQAGIEEKYAAEFIALRPQLIPEKLMEEVSAAGIKVASVTSKEYPKRLKEIYDAPALLYVRGDLKDDEWPLAVVGTRKITNYGRIVVPRIVGELAKQGIAIVSGLAFGVDALAHAVTLENKGRTVAVLGSGIDNKSIYPSANLDLARRIVASGGAVISEFPPGTPPLKQNFPHRNRIISGLSLGVLVVEADLQSGSLITAKIALDQNRDVFAVPGSILSSSSAGPHNLIKMGAKLVVSSADILECLNLTDALSFSESKKIIPDTPNEAQLLAHLSYEPMHIDKLTVLSGLDAPTVGSTLTFMEMKGKVLNLGGMNYVLAR